MANLTITSDTTSTSDGKAYTRALVANFSIADEKGRLVGGSAIIYDHGADWETQTYVDYTGDTKRSWSTRFAAKVNTTRNGADYGASQPVRPFETAEAAVAYCTKQLTGQANRYAKKYA